MEKEKFLNNVLSGGKQPVSLQKVVEEFAKKILEEETLEAVKIYDPDCRYEVGDLLYKEFDEKLRVGRDKFVEFHAGAVLKVVEKKYSKELGCYLIGLEYEGGGPLKEHFKYLARAKVGYYLPSYELKECPELPPEKDPRKTEREPSEELLKRCRREILELVEKDKNIYRWGDFLIQASSLKEINDEHIKQVEEYIKGKSSSASTEELVERVLGKSRDSEDFPIWCLSLNRALSSKKLTFVLVSKKGFGKWNTWLNLVNLEKNLPIKVKRTLPVFTARSRVEIETYLREFEKGEKKAEARNKHILTWREVLSGAVKVRKGFRNLLGGEMELKAVSRTGEYTVYYYPEKNMILGLSGYYRENLVVQASQLFLEWKEDQFELSLRTEKKPFRAPMLTYNPEDDSFALRDAEVSTEMDVETRAFLSREELQLLLGKINQWRRIRDLTALVRELVKSFGDPQQDFKIHYLKLFHLLDIIHGTPKEDLLKALLGNPEFYQEEGEFGYFKLDLNRAVEIPVEKEEKAEESPSYEPSSEKLAGFRKPKRKKKYRKPSRPKASREGFFAEKLKEALDKKEE